MTAAISDAAINSRKYNRNGTVDFMKFVFSVMIVLTHIPGLPSLYEIEGFPHSSALAVEFFFIVSGYLMAKPSAFESTSTGKATARFMLRKISVILPAYFIMYLASCVIMTLSRGYTFKTFLSLFFGSIYELFMLQMGGLHSFVNYDVVIPSAWYLSAMLIVMLIMYPILYRWRDTFLNIIAPLISLFFLGFLFAEQGSIICTYHWNGFFCKGLLRAAADISIGCICFNCCEKFRRIDLTVFSKLLLTVIEISLYGFAIYGMVVYEYGIWDFLILPILSIAVIISFSCQSYSAMIFRHGIFNYLGKLSLAIYLTHGVWIRMFRDLRIPLSLSQEVILYSAFVLSSAFFVTSLVDAVKALQCDYGEKLKNCLLSSISLYLHIRVNSIVCFSSFCTYFYTILRQHRTINGCCLCRTSACKFSVILHRNFLTYVGMPA